ncbi:MAG: RNA polymerase sigma factor [Planctomycetota bacterium]
MTGSMNGTGRTCAPGDVWARARFERSVAPHLEALHARARRVVGCDGLAWDAVQETLLRAWTRGHLPDEPRGVLLDLVHLSSLHLLRCARRRHDHESTAAHDTSACCSNDPLLHVTDAESRARITGAIADLADEYRSVLQLVAIEGASYQSAADRLGIPIGTVRSRASRARAQLRQWMEVA